VVHDSNLENYVRGRRARIRSLPDRFDVPLAPGARDESALELGIDRVLTLAAAGSTRLVRSIKFRLERLRGE
jgi:hypothetical protein